MGGAFIVSRDIFNNPIWQNNVEFRLFLLILGKAVYKKEGAKIGKIHLERGQWLRSYRSLQNDLEYIENNAVKKPGIATIKRTIDKLVRDGRIIAESTELGTLFTVANYNKYQDLGTYENQAWNEDGTAAEQQRNNNKKDKKEKKDNIYTVFEHWNSKKIIVHRELTQVMASCINARLESNAVEEILEAIDNYDKILKGDKWYWTHKWSLVEFLRRGLDKFRTENNPFDNWLVNGKTVDKNTQPEKRRVRK